MADVLARIVARKRRELAGRSAPEATPTRRSLRAALGKPGSRFIMEVKRKSPSGHRARHSLEDAVTAYAPVADAISVLVDGPDFGGSLDDLRAVRARYDGPILAKDFVVSPVQVLEARAAGADAVLAMMSVLGDHEAAAILAAAKALLMDVLVEVHDADELARALSLGASIIGINNRNLATLGIDLATTEKLAPHVPRDVLVVAESGIADRRDACRLAPLVDAFLVGSSLMAAEDIAQASRALVFGRVKVCGLTRAEDVALAAQCGATHAGFIFHPASPRRIEPEAAEKLVGVARSVGMKCVGVFAGDNPAIVGVANLLGLDAVQVHGRFDRSLKAALGPVELVATCAVRNGMLEALPDGADRILFDHRDGGSGQAFDWGLVAYSPALPTAFLAGGIGPDNARAATALGAYGLDLSSGVERALGIKDRAKLAALFNALRPIGRYEA